MKSTASASSTDKILHYNAGRDPDRLLLKYRAIASNPFSFLRGTCPLYFEQLPAHPALQHAPPAWICGDLHLENFGSYKGDNGLVYFDMNDFDEALLAPCSWEVLRLLTSILIAAPTLGAKTDAALELARRSLNSYAGALASGKARWMDRDASDGLIGQLFEQLTTRKRRDYIESRTCEGPKGSRVIRTDRGKALPANVVDQERVRKWMKSYAERQDNPGFFKIIDIARRIAGTGSLGLERFAILVEGKGGKSDPGGHYLLDLKESIPSALSGKTPCKQPKWPSESARVAELGARMQAVPPAFLEAVDLGGKPFLLKGLQPSQDRVALEGAAVHAKQLDRLMCEFGAIAAWAQLRSSGWQGSADADALIDFGKDKKQWEPLLELARHMAEQVEKDWRAFADRCGDDPLALVQSSR